MLNNLNTFSTVTQESDLYLQSCTYEVEKNNLGSHKTINPTQPSPRKNSTNPSYVKYLLLTTLSRRSVCTSGLNIHKIRNLAFKETYDQEASNGKKPHLEFRAINTSKI